MEKNNHIFVNNKKIIYELIKERQDKNMSTGLFGWVVGAAFIAAQVVVGERGIEEPRIPDLSEARLAPLHVRIDHASAARAAGGVECLQDISDKTHGRVLSGLARRACAP